MSLVLVTIKFMLWMIGARLSLMFTEKYCGLGEVLPIAQPTEDLFILAVGPSC